MCTGKHLNKINATTSKQNSLNVGKVGETNTVKNERVNESETKVFVEKKSVPKKAKNTAV